MKNSKNNTKATYTIDFTNSKIIATASFMEKAGQYGSQEYHTIMCLRKDLPEFEIELLEEKNSSKKKGCLNLDTMEAYIIRICGDKSDEIKEFYKVREESKVEKSGRYSYMKKWFHEVYPEGYKLLSDLTDKDLKMQQRKDVAHKLVENVFTIRNAVSKENGNETKKTSADPEGSAENLKKTVDQE